MMVKDDTFRFPIEVYESTLWRTFKYHPNGPEIVPAILAGELPIPVLDQVFEEAAEFSWAHVLGQEPVDAKSE
jgi:hypothetical protein